MGEWLFQMRLDLLDAKIVKDIMFNPEILDLMSDDHAEDYLAVAGPYVAINMVKTILGMPTIYFLHPNEHTLFMLTMRTMTLFEVHTMILPEGRGGGAIEATREAARWMFKNTSCEKIVTYVPKFNRKARIFAKIVGMKDEGICTKSFRKNGILHDQWVLGLEKEILCQQ